MPRLLLLSNSRNPGGEFLAHARDPIAGLLGAEPRRLAFVPYAGVTISPDAYVARVREALSPLGHSVESLHEGDPVEVLRQATGVIVGGGNTFRLLERLYQTDLLHRIRQKVLGGTPYLGWSAGANLACPTIRTTNDMPIVAPPSLVGLGLVPFQINPHYTDDVLPNHGGESRADRIGEFLLLNPAARVVGLREGSWLRVETGRVTLEGRHPMKLFRAGVPPEEIAPGTDLTELLG